MSFSYDNRERQFIEYLRDGISAAKSGQRKLAQSLLNRAIYLNGGDARPYLWLTATTDDRQEQIDYLEKAVSLDPANAEARRGLALLKGKIDPAKLIPEGGDGASVSSTDEIEVEGRSFICPRCGGRMVFSTLSGRLACEYCAYEERGLADEESGGQLASLADQSEQVLDFVMPTTVGHRWAQAQQHLCCERCGAHSLLPPGQKTTQCPYCGSNQVVGSAVQEDLMEPQLIAVMEVSKEQAAKLAHRWLGKGFFSPDSLIRSSATVRLRPGYYSFWTFDGTVELRWTCEVAEGSGNYKTWQPVSGAETSFFNDALVPGVKALGLQEIKSLEPFDLENVETFNPDYLAGWPAVLYDRSLSDASLVAREGILKNLKPQLYGLVEVGREKRNLNIGGSQWSGMTFKHILLPLWIGEYLFQGKSFRLLINGQTGKVSGEKPRDSVKVIFLFLLAVVVVVFFVMLYLIFGGVDLGF
jgi:hypothetical protein